jgi:oxaloacetate decarboxylase gamma subunit
MSIVFSFLILMVFVLKLQAKLIGKFFPEEAAKAQPSKVSAPKQEIAKNDDSDVVAAITAAVIHHRK